MEQAPYTTTCILLHDNESLQWRYNEHDGVSNHQPHDCLLKRLFRRRSKETSKPCVTGLCVGNSPVTCEFPTQGPAMRQMFPFDNVIMITALYHRMHHCLWVGWAIGTVLIIIVLYVIIISIVVCFQVTVWCEWFMLYCIYNIWRKRIWVFRPRGSIPMQLISIS